MARPSFNPWLTPLLAFTLVGCPPPAPEKPEDTGTGDTSGSPLDTSDSAGDTSDSAVDTSDSAGDTSDSAGDTSDSAGDTSDSAEPAATFAVLVDDADIVEVTDVAVDGEDGVYVVGIDSAGDGGIWWVEADGSAVTAVAMDMSLTQPTGIALSEDGNTLFVSDLATPSPSGAMNGAVYSLPSGGGALTEVGTADQIDLPGDVAVIPGGGGLFVSGFDSAGLATIFVVNGGVSVGVSGGSLVDPTALAVSPDGGWLFVVDSLAAAGRASILSFELPGFAPTELESGFDVAFPGGVGTDGASVWYSTVGDPGLLEMAADGSGFSVVDTVGLMELPTGIAVGTNRVYVTESAHDAGADLYLYSF